MTSPPSEPGLLPSLNAARWYLAVVLLALIFLLDAATPADVNVPALYVLPTLVFIWARRFQEPFVVAAIATVLTVAGLYVSAAGPDGAAALLNRLVAIGLIWATAALVVSCHRAVERWGQQITGAHYALQDSVRRLQDLRYAIDQSAIVAATDQRGIINYVNDKFCEISKFSREELIGQDHRIINSRYHPKEFIRSIWRTIAQGEVWRGEIRNRAKDGTFYWVDTTIVPFLNEQGKPWQYLSIRNDITERKAAEEKLRDEAALTQLGRLSAVVAHEVRNPLAGLKGSLQVLASRLPADLPGREILNPMVARIDALEQSVQDILTYARPSTPKRQRFDARTLLADAARSAQAAVKSAQIEMSGDTAVLHADPEMCRAVLLNLLLNACQASGDAPVTIHSRVDDRYLEIVISDRGPGIPEEVRQQLFEPFVTTKAGGTGLGLPIARRLTQLLDGQLMLRDNDHGGTDAVLKLPTTAAEKPSGPVETFPQPD